MLTSEDEHFTNAICNNIEKLCRQIIGVIFKPISSLIAISLPINVIMFVRQKQFRSWPWRLWQILTWETLAFNLNNSLLILVYVCEFEKVENS